MSDAVTRGRYHRSCGETAYRAKLSDVQVNEIRSLYATGSWTQVALADRFGITHGYVSKVIHRVNRG